MRDGRPLLQAGTVNARRFVLALPATGTELADQVRELIPHRAGCRWTSTRRTWVRPGQTVAQAEAAQCTCPAHTHRTHLVDLLNAAAAGDLDHLRR